MAWQATVALAAIAVAAFFYFMVRGTAELYTPRDALAYWSAAHHARGGISLYDSLAPGPHEFRGHWPYLYPPFLAGLLALLPATDYATFDIAWTVFSLCGLLCYGMSLARLHRCSWNGGWGVLWTCAVMAVPGTLNGLRFGNVDILILALIGLGLAAPAWAGAPLMLAALVKPMPVWPLAALATRSPRVLRGAAWAGGLVGVVCAAALGPIRLVRESWHWLARVAPVLGQGQWWRESLNGLRFHFGADAIWDNLSASFAPVQIAVLRGWWGYTGGPLPAGVRAWLALFAIAVPVLVLIAARRRSPVMQAALVATAAILAAPIVRSYVLSIVLLPLAVWLGERRSRPKFPGNSGGGGKPGTGEVPAAGPESAATMSPDPGAAA